MKSFLVLALFVLGFASIPQASAQRAVNRNARQSARIETGLARGDISPREARRLDAQQSRVHRAQRRAVSDGVVTRREAVHVERMQDRSNRNIRRQANDRNRR